jgi:hypothetical protein
MICITNVLSLRTEENVHVQFFDQDQENTWLSAKFIALCLQRNLGYCNYWSKLNDWKYGSRE